MPPKITEPAVIDFDSPEYESAEAPAAEALTYNLDRIVSLAEDSINTSSTKQQAVVDAVDSALEAALVAVDVLYVSREEQGVTQVSLLHGSWEPEAPPPPCAMDTWLRAAIPESAQPKQSYALDKFLSQQVVPTGAGGRRSDSRRSSNMVGAAGSVLGAAPHTPSGRTRSPNRTGGSPAGGCTGVRCAAGTVVG